MSLLTHRAPVLPLGALPRVDLLPPSEMRRRDMLSRARTWVYLAAGALAIAVLAVGAAFAYNLASSVRLGLEQARTQQILVGIAGLSDVSAALATRGELQVMRQEAMAGDLAWGAVVGVVASRLPDGVVITGYALDAGPAPVEGTEATEVTGVSGTVTFTSPAAIDFVAVTRELRRAEGMLAADLDGLTSSDGVFTYIVRVELDQTVYTGTFAPEAG